ncbi:MAG TPA: homocysteine S-methyltransferase family protein [Planctomycetaceae bacterium]|nr:homocysteine S-methyltransferase family protein [Planctomycetaceae bacterium]
MAMYRDGLPQMGGQPFLTDSGLETTLVFRENIPLPHFASIVLVDRPDGIELLQRYFYSHVELAHAHGMGIVLESTTWRASADWGRKLGYTPAALIKANSSSIKLIEQVRAMFPMGSPPIVISGNMGPRGDGYQAHAKMTVEEAMRYHQTQADCLAHTNADMLAAFTLNYVEEAIGIVRAAQRARMPIAISFTLETDGRLPSGMMLGDAIERTDAMTDGYPLYYMINCAHPSHFAELFHEPAEWHQRLRGLRANASKRSHAELDNSPNLDIGDPNELGEDYRMLCEMLPQLNIFGGCCGTDLRHVAAIAAALKPGMALVS